MDKTLETFDLFYQLVRSMAFNAEQHELLKVRYEQARDFLSRDVECQNKSAEANLKD